MAPHQRSLRSAVRYVRAECGTIAEPNTSMWMNRAVFNPIYGNCKAGDGTDQHIWFFVGGRFVGTDASAVEVDHRSLAR
jgi:hypothetical protein